ncbi:MAG: YlxR family protein [Acidimicrobiia bacterium]
MAAPRRTCVGCRRVAAPGELVRVVRTGDGGLAVGRSLPGRGAWLCAGSPGCMDRAERRGALTRALKAPIRPEAVEGLRAQLRERARMEDCGIRS